MIIPQQFSSSKEAFRACLTAARRDPDFQALIWRQVAWEDPDFEDPEDLGGWYFDHARPEAWVTTVYERPPDGRDWVIYSHVKPVTTHQQVFPFATATQAAIAAGLPAGPEEKN